MLRVGSKLLGTFLLENLYNLFHRLFQKLSIFFHIRAVTGLCIKQLTQFIIRRSLILAKQAIDFEYLLGLGIIVSYGSVITDINQEIRIQRINLFIPAAFAFL